MQDSSAQSDDSFIPTKNSATQTQDSTFQINEGVDPSQTKTNYDNFRDPEKRTRPKVVVNAATFV